MSGLDLSTFGPWRSKVCDGCDTLRLTTGPPEGPHKCKYCWLGLDPPKPRKKAQPGLERLRR